ncbi:hypothetical protein MTR67_052165 [Solanum verrucosum]|uniref:Uncharacterized protein n=1 Tax=Solanum verrucosum TaxID=315347 RepID=A0AAF0V594_SOLVR|nr:hypothetical protein MTR67_052165 [Solanum verrucosum]
MKGVMRFGKKEKLSPRYVSPYRILKRVASIVPLESVAVKDILTYEEDHRSLHGLWTTPRVVGRLMYDRQNLPNSGIRPGSPPRAVVLMMGRGLDDGPTEEPRQPSRSVVLHKGRGRALVKPTRTSSYWPWTTTHLTVPVPCDDPS